MGYETDFSLKFEIPNVKTEDTPLFKTIHEFLSSRYGDSVHDEHVIVLIAKLDPFVKAASLDEDDLVEELEELSGYSFEYYSNAWRASGKWYDHEKHMLEFSKKYPLIEFTLDGDGEEQGDVWRHVYFGGSRVKAQKAKLVFED